MGRLSAPLLLLTLPLAAQTPAPKPFLSHEVNADSTITFRVKAPAAKKATVLTDAQAKPLILTMSPDGIWSATTSALAPEYYGYTFFVDGVPQCDPRNRAVKPNYVDCANVVEVPGPTPQPWDTQAIPHGAVTRHVYTTHIAKNLAQSQNAYVVYTPPGYDAHRKTGYPVLYLLHGWSDDETGWTAVGHANDILDSFIASGKAEPMIVVMPAGYGDFDFVTHGYSVWVDEAKVNANVALFTQTLEEEVMPAVYQEYNIAKGRENHAIAGLSMGGLEALYTGLAHTDQFAWVAGMSSAIHGEKFDEHLPNLDAKKANLKLLWVSCGSGDGLIRPNRDFVAWAKAKNFDVTVVETSGYHTWLTWRDNLLHLAPMLFRNQPASN